MQRAAVILLLFFACGAPDPNAPRVSKEPISVRGWISDVAGSPRAPFQTPETDAVRRQQLFEAVTVWVDNAPYVSGAVARNGAFIFLDVPPGNTAITFTAPGAPAARLVLQNIPGNADVLVPAVLLKPDSVALLEPKGVQVRVAANVSRSTPTGKTAIVAGLTVPVLNTPVGQMADRHDYPNVPGFTPLATVK